MNSDQLSVISGTSNQLSVISDQKNQKLVTDHSSLVTENSSLITRHSTFTPFRPGELKVFRKRTRLPGHSWAERNIHVPIGSRQGLYRNANNPAMRGILDWATRPHVRTVVLAKGIQVGGTLAFYSLMLREAEYSSDSALIVMADERSVKKLSKKRLQPMIDKSPALSAIKSSNPDDTTIYSITLGHGFTIDIGWASSEMSVSSESYRVVILDEISKYKTRANIEDAKARTTVFPDTKRIWIFSSPGVDTDDPNNRDPLMVEAENCDVMLDYHAICPDCGTEQVMLWENFKWPAQLALGISDQSSVISGSSNQSSVISNQNNQKLVTDHSLLVTRHSSPISADPKAIRRTKSAWYQCTGCGSRWNDYKRDKAVLSAMENGWQQTDAEKIEFPQSVFFHFPSWLSPYVSLSDIVADWLEAQDDQEKLRKWFNRHAGISYVQKNKSDRKEDDILRLCDSRIEGQLPAVPIAAITAVADMQKRGFWYTIRAWGSGLEAESWLLKHGYVDSWEALEHIFFRSEFRSATGEIFLPTLWAMDSGGGESEQYADMSRTAECYLWCIKHPEVIPFKGNSRMQQIYTRTTIDKLPGTNKPLPGIVPLHNINSRIFKNRLASKLLIDGADPGAWHLHSGLREEDVQMGNPASMGREYLRSFATQMCSETLVGVNWENPGRKANHLWDCSTYEMALCEIAQVKFWPAPNSVIVEEKPIAKKQKTRRW